jgi:DnaK suppressor protein
MTRRQLVEQIESVLRRRRDALRRALSGELGGLGAPRCPAVGDPLDAALDSEYAEISSELAETEARELVRVERALERLHTGCYGVCEICGRTIPLARLQALPYATLCIRCQTLDEAGRRGKQDGDDSKLVRDTRDGSDGPNFQTLDLVE